MKRKRVRFRRRPLGTLSLFGRQASARFGLLMGLVGGKGGALLAPAMSEVAFCYFQTSASTDSASDIQMSVRSDLLLTLFLATWFLCDTACSTAIGLLAERLIAPLCRRVRERRPASSTNSPGRIRSLRQWLCSPCRNDRNCRPFRSVQISHNPPPGIPSLSTHCCV